MKRVLILGAGIAGLELATVLSDEVPDEVDVTIVDSSDAFVFGFSKLDLMFGRKVVAGVRVPYSHLDKPAVRFVRETILTIDPEARRVTTNAAPMSPTSLSWRWVQTWTQPQLQAWPRRARSSTPSKGRPGSENCCPPSRGATSSSACWATSSSARPRRSRPHSCCTTTWRSVACGRHRPSRSSALWGCPSPFHSKPRPAFWKRRANGTLSGAPSRR